VRTRPVPLRTSAGAASGCGRGPAGPAGAGGTPGVRGSTQGGGVRNAGGTVRAVSSIFGDNFANGGPAHDFSGDFATATNNLLKNNTGSNLAAANPDANGNRLGSRPDPLHPRLPQ